MQSHRWTALVVMLILTLALHSTLLAQESTEEAEGSFVIYVVQSGDTLVRIAARFSIDPAVIADDNNINTPYTIFPGQQLRIRAEQDQPAATAQPTTGTPSTEAVTYVVQSGDTLFRIATRFGTTVRELVRLNNLPNENVIYPGQTLIISGSLATATPTAASTTPLPPAVDPGFNYGIEVFITPDNLNQTIAQVSDLGITWVKVEINWRIYEPTQGQINFAALDALVDGFEAQGVELLLTVTAAPDWARSSENEDGPPDNVADYATFVGALAERYAGRVTAYEIWTEPNLRREWNSEAHPIGAEGYLELLTAAYSAIKAADPAAIVVSAGLAPTGFNDRINAVNDRVFLSELYDNGLAAVSDAVGAHPGGWANPPDSTCCDAAEGVETHFEDRSFYFRDTLTDYRQIMADNDDVGTPIWVTEFGWGTNADTEPAEDGSVNVFVNYTDLSEQAAYTPRAFEIGLSLGYVGPMFLSNLNGCAARPGSAEACYYSLTTADGSPRPVYSAVQAVDKTQLTVPTPTPTSTSAPIGTSEATTEPPAATAEPTAEATDLPAATLEPTAEVTAPPAPATEEPAATEAAVG